MAIDEALLEVAKVPSIRFYSWQSPALSFGYFGKFADVAEYATERDLVRRWTGGGIVFHGEDLTYSIVIPANDPVFAESSMSIYEKIHCALCNALVAGGQRATAAGVPESERLPEHARCHSRQRCSHAPVARSTPRVPACHDGPQGRGYNPPLCFANTVRADVMLNGHKIAGAAQRRTRSGWLHQGSIQNVDLANGLTERFAQALSAKCSDRKIDNDVLKRACELAKQKYAAEDWLRKR